MTEAIPKWVIERYSALYRENKRQPFTREQANIILDKYGLKKDDKLTNVFFSELNKKGWVEIKRNKENAKKKIYRLVSPEKAVLNLRIGN